MNVVLRVVRNMYVSINRSRMKNRIKYLRKKGAKIGNDCEIYLDVDFGSEPYLITIGNHVRINRGVKLYTHDGGMWVLRGNESLFGNQFRSGDKFGRIEIGNNVHIGTDAIILPNVSIGDNCIVGCGAVVTKDVGDNSVVAGVPARYIESIIEYSEKMKNQTMNTKTMSASMKEKIVKEKFEGSK